MIRSTPIEGWHWSKYITTDITFIQSIICIEHNGTRNGETEVVDNGARVRFECEKDDGSGGTIPYIDYYINWAATCQRGFRVEGYTSTPRPSIDSCVKTGLIEGQPELCCETGGNPIFISSRRKVQTEVDYQGQGSYPLVFSRTYTSGAPGRVSKYLDYAGIQVWGHNFKKRLSGDLTGTGGGAPSHYEGAGSYYVPEPPTSGGGVGGDFNAHRPDRSIIRFTDFTAGSAQRVSLTRGSTPQGDFGFVLKTASDESEFYNQNGQLVATRSRQGETHYLSYGGGNQLQSVTDDYGRSLTFEYQAGNISAMIDPAGNRTEYTYNQYNDVVTVQYPDTGSGTAIKTYLYEADPRFLTGIVNERGDQYTSWTYATDTNFAGLATGSSGPDGINQVEIGQYGGSPATRVVNALGLQTLYRFSVVNGGRVLTSKDRLATETTPGAAETRSYNDDGFLVSITDWNGNTTTYERDSRGLPLSETLAAGTDDERTITREWHPDYRVPLSETHPDYRVDYERDAWGNVLIRTVTDSASSESRIWSYSYDGFGKLLTIDGPRHDVADIITLSYYNCTTSEQCGRLSQVNDALGFVTQFTDYNANGQLTRSVDANGVVSAFDYDARRRLISTTIAGATTTFNYDPASNVTQVTLPDGTYTQYSWDVVNRLVGVNDSEGNSISWELDAAGNQINETYSDPANSVRFAQNRAFDALSQLIDTGYSHGGHDQYEYDPNGNLAQTLDSEDRAESSTHDALDRLTMLRDAVQGLTSFAYDSQDNLTSVTDPEGKVTTYTYNGFGDRLSESSPDTGVTNYSVDAAGNRLTSIDARGITKAYTYDALNRPVSITYPDSAEAITYGYDQGSNGVGQLTSVSDESGNTAFGYDSRGNLTSSTRTIGAQTYQTSYQYNGADRLISMSYPSGRVIEYSYDASGRISAVTSTDSDGEAESLASSIGRLPFGPLTSLTLGNGIERSHDYDQDYRIESIADTGVLARGYAWNAVNNITAITDGIDPGASQLFTYDDLDRLNFATGSYGERSYTYDGVGNRLSLERAGTANDGTDSYQYGSAGHRLDEIVGQKTYDYDAVGNTVSAGTQSFVYNQRSRMASATVEGVTTTYQYNALGQRVVKSNATATTHFVFDQSGLLIAEADDSGTVFVEYAYLDGQPLVMWREDAVTEPEVPPVPTFLLPQGSSDTATPTFSWEPLADILRYQIIVFDRAVGGQVHNAQYVADEVCTTECAVRPTGVSLSYSTNHFWRVRARNTAGWGEWSDPIRFDYVDAVVDTVTAVSPIGSSDTATPTYQWDGIDGVTEYKLIVFDRVVGAQVHNERYTTDAICNIDADSATGTLCGVVPEDIDLSLSTNHFWRIRAKNSGGWGTWSDPIRFDYVENVPGEVLAMAPIGVSDTGNPAYQWQHLASATDYEFFVHDRSTGTRIFQSTFPENEICTATSCSVTPDGVSVGFATNHFWRVRAKNSGGWGAWTPAIRFNYIDERPGLVTGLSPIDTAESTATPTFTWQSLPGAVNYQFLVFDRTVGGQILNERYTAAELCTESSGMCSLLLDGVTLTDNTNHFWRIRAFNSGGWGEWSAPLRFDVDAGVAQ